MPIVVTGIKELLANLTKVSTDVKKIERKALLAGAKIIRDEIEVQAPVGATHNLKDNIVITDFKKDADGGEYVYIGPNVKGKDAPFYASFVEFGTIRQRAAPFVEPSFIFKKQEALESMVAIVKAAVESSD